MKLSYAICVCTEHRELDTLLDFLTQVKDEEDEIVVLVDNTKDCKEVTMVLARYNGLCIFSRAFNNDFSAHKNYLNRKCTGDYIFNIDADEVPTETLVKSIKDRIKNENPDVIFIPRINMCLGQTSEFIKRREFRLNEVGWINWPDHQGRIYRNHKDIYWTSTLHETLGGPECKVKTAYQPDPKYALIHVKTAKKQDEQGKFYEKITDQRIVNDQV